MSKICILIAGIVINDGPASSDPKGYGSVEVVTVDETGMVDGKVGEIFDVTVTAKQSFGGKVTGQPFQVAGKIKNIFTVKTKLRLR